MVRVKGSAVTARVRYVRDHHGEEAWRDLRTQLTPESQADIERGVLPHNWASYDLFIDLNVTIDRVFGHGDLRLCYEMGRYGATVNLPTLYRLFLRFGHPMYLLEKAARLWQVNYDSGRLLAVERGPTEARLRIEDFEQPHRAHCLSVLGWASRAIELTGAKVLLADEGLCRTRGDEACEMSVGWR